MQELLVILTGGPGPGGRDHFSKDDVVFIDHFHIDDIERFGWTDHQKIAIFGRRSLWMVPNVKD